MKQAFINTLTDLMENDDNVVVVTADMGFSVFEDIQMRFSKRFFNTGIAEQASTSFVAGLALSGYKVYFYAQAPFITMRCFEQVRLDIAYNFLDVKLIGSNAGFSLNQYGVSHFGLEDIALMKTLPGMTIFTPADSVEMNKVINESYKIKGPVYVRMTKTGNTTIHKNKAIDVMRPLLISKGRDGLLMVSGGLLERAMLIVQDLKKRGINIELFSCPLIKPINEKLIISLLSKHKYIFTLEEHSIIGGFGSTIANMLVDNNLQVRLTKFALPDKYLHISGSIDYLLDKGGLSIDTISHKITEITQK
ncbi:MAG: transketolase C-terminal domain-containing protein [bacterium]|nr:transketolase C-terminal domain-containing protein [bacterium]